MTYDKKRLSGLAALLLCIIITIGLFPSFDASAEGSKQKIVRVGWYESPFCHLESNGRRSGYAYEYQQKIAGYVEWEYEYVEGSWPELFEMLKNGEIDLMSDVSYTEERASQMLFCHTAMGSELYYVYISPDNTNFVPGDINSLQGKKVGVNKGSYQMQLYKNWAEENGIRSELIELTTSESESIEMLMNGELDAYVSIDGFGLNDSCIPVFKIGQSDFYFVVSNERHDLYEELNLAMSKIEDEDRSYNQKLYEKYVKTAGANTFLSNKERNWLSAHGEIRVGYLEDYLPFCASDPETGELKGALRDFLKEASDSLSKVELEFSAAPFATIKDAFDALHSGEIDCVFPVNLRVCDAETLNVSVTTPFIETEVYSAIRKSDHIGSFTDDDLIVAVCEEDYSIETFLMDFFPEMNVVYCKNEADAFRAVSEGAADGTLFSNYRVTQTEAYRKQYKLTSMPSGKAMSYSFAIRRTDGELDHIMNKVCALVPYASVDSALLSYSWPDGKFSLFDFLSENIMLVILFIFFIALIIVVLLIRRADRMKRQLNERIRLQEALSNALSVAEEASRSKTTFLNNMSHDIRTPMNAIMGFTDLAIAHADNKEQVLNYLDKISVSSHHLLSLINDVLDMSRIESGKMTLNEAAVHLPDIIHDLKTIINSSASAKNVRLYVNMQDVVSEDIVIDKLRLNQILLNILSNAIKFTPEGGEIHFSVIEKPDPEPERASFEFRIKDNGIGMSEEFRKTVFQSFTRESTSTVSGIQGTGLGMAITKNIVDMMGGTITVNSKQGEGSEFIVELSCRLADTPTAVEQPPELKGLHVLVTDDDFDSCMSLCSLLEDLGMRPEHTGNGKDAVARACEAKEKGDEFSVYIIDWMMPDMNGIDTLKQIRKKTGGGKPAIMLTAYDWTDIEDEAKEAGVTAFCSKPLFRSELKNALIQPFRKKKEGAGEKETFDFTGKRVLLAEDNEMNQLIAKANLVKVGFEVDIAADGEIAVQKMKDAPAGTYDVILMDIQMPRMDGYAATHAIRELDDQLKANIPIVAVTANAFDEDRQKATDEGMNGHLAKPYDIKAMMKLLKKLTE